MQVVAVCILLSIRLNRFLRASCWENRQEPNGGHSHILTKEEFLCSTLSL